MRWGLLPCSGQAAHQSIWQDRGSSSAVRFTDLSAYCLTPSLETAEKTRYFLISKGGGGHSSSLGQTRQTHSPGTPLPRPHTGSQSATPYRRGALNILTHGGLYEPKLPITVGDEHSDHAGPNHCITITNTTAKDHSTSVGSGGATRGKSHKAVGSVAEHGIKPARRNA